MRLFLVAVVAILLRHFEIEIPTESGIMNSIILGFVFAVVQDIKEILK